LMELARSEGRCQEVAGKITATGGLTSGRPAGMAHVRINQVSSRQAVNNPSLIDLSTGRILTAPHPYRCRWRSH
jgi:hypothetical protein